MTANNYFLNSFRVPSFDEICIETLKNHNLHGLVLDYDGVLSSHGEIMPSDQNIEILKKLVASEIFLAIHSNNPIELSEKRQKWMKINFPSILWMPPRPHKPNPSTLLHLAQRWKISPENIAMIDDRFTTGGLAAFRSKSKFILVQNPLVNFRKRFYSELWFSSLRWVEKMIYELPANEIKRTQEDSNL